MSSKVFARGANIVLGAWLFISSFLWSHSQPQFTNAWMVGLLVSAIAIIGLWAPPIRFANTALSVWLLLSAWLLPGADPGTQWNHVLVAIAVFVLSLIPNAPLSARGTRMVSGQIASGAHSA